MLGYIEHARSTSTSLFAGVDWVRRWSDFLAQAEPAADALCDIGVECFGAVLPLSESLCGHPPPSRGKGEGTAVFTPSSIGGYREGLGTLRAHGVDLQNYCETGDVCGTVQAAQSRQNVGHAVAFTQNQAGDVLTGAVCPSMGTNQNATGRNTPKVYGSGVRRLTPRECERLMGLPDDYTLIPYRNKPAADAPRYKALGNSMACNVMAWIGQRIDMVEKGASDGS